MQRGGVDVRGGRGLPGTEPFPCIRSIAARLRSELVEEERDLAGAGSAEGIRELAAIPGRGRGDSVRPEDRGLCLGTILGAAVAVVVAVIEDEVR